MTTVNSTLHPVMEAGWRRGFSNLFRNENDLRWGRRRWLAPALIWIAILNGFVLLVALANAQDGSMSPAAIASDCAQVFVSIGALATAIGESLLWKLSLLQHPHWLPMPTPEREVNMTTKISTSFVQETTSYATSTTNSEQHSLPRSIALHLLPGILTGAVLFLLAPIVQQNGLPALWAHGIADLIIILPFIFWILFYQGYKKNGKWSLDGIVLYRERIPFRQYLIFVPIVFFSAGIVPLFAPVSNFIFDKLFSWWPAMYNLSYDLRGYSPSIITATFIFNFLMIGLLVPIAEELYFRGYLLPRLSRFGFWAVPIHTTIFGLFHVWTPWMAVARAIGAIPFAFVVQRKQNIYIGMIAHILFNTLDVVMGVMLILNL